MVLILIDLPVPLVLTEALWEAHCRVRAWNSGPVKEQSWMAPHGFGTSLPHLEALTPREACLAQDRVERELAGVFRNLGRA